MGKTLNDGVIAAAMTWVEPDRDMTIARTRALTLIDQGSLHCVWSGKQLTTQTLDMDHAFPWSAWPCGDLWNLMPAHRAVNQRKKKNKLPTADLLNRSRDNVLSWWRDAYECAVHLY